MKNIDDLNIPYRIARRYVNFAFKNYYNNYIVSGLENIPDKGPIIFAPNHLNALMDAIAVLSSAPHRFSIVFIARSDVFSTDIARKAMRFLKILPAFRIRDGIENLGKNQEIFDLSVDILERKNAMCIMPEGNQGEQRRLQPLVKGIFRIAFAHQLIHQDIPHLKIVPVGLDYSNFINYGEDLIINYGQPIEVADYINLYRQNQAVAINKIRADLSKSLHDVTVDIASQENYEVLEELIWFLNTDFVLHQHLENNLENRFKARQKLAALLVKAEKNDPQRLHRATDEYKKLQSALEAIDLKPDCFDFDKQKKELLTHPLILLLTSPLCLAGLILNFIPFFGSIGIRKLVGVKKKGFYSSVYYFTSFILFPICYLLQTLAYRLLIPDNLWWTAIILLPSQLYLGKLAFGWYKGMLKFCYRFSYGRKKKTHKESIDKLKAMKENIFEIVIKH
ncbi:MAG: 1-acyl-sn-glycerol-3-phosphate acyltransferase [Prevotellaceae bacterium]|jgi:1-acyl-sn-glycerol-3-phosphate acyltransferase|nr:1-acyl-sn-glycerol-3-phosphate acyltransferase [Prevotellaceae bacterium]